MAEYHVSTSDITGVIYAGNGRKDGPITEFRDKSDVTNEAINAVMAHMLQKIKPGENGFAYANTTLDGKYIRLKIEVSEHKPDWL